MDIVPNSIMVSVENRDKMMQFQLQGEQGINEDYYYLADREYAEISKRLIASGIPHIYMPNDLNDNIYIVSFDKVKGEIFLNTHITCLKNNITLNHMVSHVSYNLCTNIEQSKLGNKYSIVQLLSED